VVRRVGYEIPANSAGLNAITPVRFHMTDFEFGGRDPFLKERLFEPTEWLFGSGRRCEGVWRALASFINRNRDLS
jgi:hypothetical protein